MGDDALASAIDPPLGDLAVHLGMKLDPDARPGDEGERHIIGPGHETRARWQLEDVLVPAKPWTRRDQVRFAGGYLAPLRLRLTRWAHASAEGGGEKLRTETDAEHRGGLFVGLADEVD